MRAVIAFRGKKWKKKKVLTKLSCGAYTFNCARKLYERFCGLALLNIIIFTFGNINYCNVPLGKQKKKVYIQGYLTVVALRTWNLKGNTCSKNAISWFGFSYTWRGDYAACPAEHTLSLINVVAARVPIRHSTAQTFWLSRQNLLL